MECNECEKEVACIYMICPDCVEAKDREITALRTQLADREAGTLEWLSEREQHIVAIRLLQEEKANLKLELSDREAVIKNFWKAFGWIETSWLQLNSEEEAALQALKAKGEI